MAEIKEEKSKTRSFFEEARANEDKFVVPLKHQNFKRVDANGSKSIVFQYGVKLVQFEGEKLNRRVKGRWYCLLEPCFSSKKNLSLDHSSTSNVAQHLERVHSILSTRTQKLIDNQKLSRTKKSIGVRMSKSFPERYYYLVAALHAALNGVSFRSICGDDFARFFVAIEDFPKLYEKKLKNFLLDIYMYVMNECRQKLQSMKKKYKVPFLHLSADIYTSTILQVKFLGLRAAYIDLDNLSFKSFNLGVKVFEPSTMERSKKSHLSDVMFEWVKEIFSSFNISEDDIMSTTSDSGSDIKRLMSKCLGKPSEWCLAHLLNCALVDAFGVSQSIKNCKNLEARAISTSLRRVIEHVNKSPKARTIIREHQKALGGKEERLANFINQRWASAYIVYEKFLRNYKILYDYVGYENTKFNWPPELKKRVVQEFYSILKVIWDIIRKSQNDNICALDVLSELYAFYVTNLQPNKGIRIFEVSSTEEETEFREFEDLDKITQTVVLKLKSAIDQRFFYRYHPSKAYTRKLTSQEEGAKSDFKFSYAFEAGHLLVPMWRNGNILNNLVRMVSDDSCTEESIVLHYKRIINRAWVTLTEVVVENGSKLDPDLLTSKDNPITTPKKKRRTEKPGYVVLNDLFIKERRTRKPSLKEKKNQEEVSVSDIVFDQIARYCSKNSELDKIGLDEKNSVLKFWKSELEGSRFPLLARVALAFLAIKASSAGLERDFSPASDLFTRKRGNLKPWLAEVLMGIRLHKEFIPSDLMQINEKDQAMRDFQRQQLEKSEVDDMLGGLFSEQANNSYYYASANESEKKSSTDDCANESTKNASPDAFANESAKNASASARAPEQNADVNRRTYSTPRGERVRRRR